MMKKTLLVLMILSLVLVVSCQVVEETSVESLDESGLEEDLEDFSDLDDLELEEDLNLDDLDTLGLE